MGAGRGTSVGFECILDYKYNFVKKKRQFLKREKNKVHLSILGEEIDENL